MPSFIEKKKAEIAAQKNSHEYEDYLINRSINRIKQDIEEAMKKEQHEYWSIIDYEDGWDYTMLKTHSSLFDENQNFFSFLESHHTSLGLGRPDGFDSGYRKYRPKPEDIDFSYINSTMKRILQELGCKEIYLAIGPYTFIVKNYRVEKGKGLFGKEKRVPYETTVLNYRWAVRVTW